MAKKEDSPAKLAIIREWDAWSQEHPGDAEIQDCMLFFSFLERERPDLLNFESVMNGRTFMHGC